MSEKVFETLRQCLEKRDNELGRTSPSLNLQCDERYRKLASIVRAQLGRAPTASNAATGNGSSSADHNPTERGPGQELNCGPSSSQDRGDTNQLRSKTGYRVLPTTEDDMELIDLLEDSVEILPSKAMENTAKKDQPNKLPRLFSDEDETMVLDPLPCSQPQEKQPQEKHLQDDIIEKTVEKRKADQQNQSSKRRRTKKPPKEVRGDRYRSAPAKWILERMQRHTQRLCLIRFESRGEDGMVFDVMGTNGNIYKVVIGLHPTCTCMDFTGRAAKGKNGPCKHLIFAFLRVFKLEREDPRWWQTRLVPSELKDLLEKRPAHLGDGVMADERVRRQLDARTAKEGTGRRPIGGDCPVCYEDLLEADGARPEDVTTFCKECGNNFHKLCLVKWIQSQRVNPTCPMCRQVLRKDEKEQEEEGYINLAAYSSAHQRQLTLAEMYSDTHQYIGTGGRGRRRGRGR